MALGGQAWRGWFPLGGELTSGRPDWKEGLYLGTELPDEHPRVKASVPLHGANLTPGDDVLPDFRRTVLEYIDQVTRLGHRVLAAIAASLGLAPDYFALRYTGYTADPLILFRIFRSGASRNSFFGMKFKAHGAQQPECTPWYMRIASTGQRGSSPEQRIYRGAPYPSRPVPDDMGAPNGVGEHTDDGLLTLLRQDAARHQRFDELSANGVK